MAPDITADAYPPPSSPPQFRYTKDVFDQLRQEMADDSDNDSLASGNTEEELNAILATDDVDGPTDFTANFSYWMHHADLKNRNPPDEILPSDSEVDDEVELEEAQKGLLDGDVTLEEVQLLAEEPAAEADDDFAEKVIKHAPENNHVEASKDLEKDGLVNHAVDTQKIVHNARHQPSVEDATDMPTEIDFDRKTVKPMSYAEAERLVEADSRQNMADDETHAERDSGEFPAHSLGPISPQQIQIDGLVKEVERLRLNLELAMNALAEGTAERLAAATEDGEQQQQQQQREQEEQLFEKLDILQQTTIAQAKTTQAEMMTLKQAVKTAIDELLEDILQCQDEIVNVREGQVQAAKQQGIEGEPRGELAAAKIDRENLRLENVELRIQLAEAKARNEELERDRLLMSRVLLKEWGRQECKASKPQKYRYQYATG